MAKAAKKNAAKKAAKKAVKKATPPKVISKKTRKTMPTAKKGMPASTRTLTRDGAVGGAENENTTLDTLYIVNDSNNPVTLEVNVGAEEQTGNMTIKIDGAIIIENHPGDFPETILGTNKAMNGKKLTIVATIADTSKKTNFTSLSIHLKGGTAPNDFNLSKTVDEEGASADYLCLIEFFKP